MAVWVLGAHLDVILFLSIIVDSIEMMREDVLVDFDGILHGGHEEIGAETDKEDDKQTENAFLEEITGEFPALGSGRPKFAQIVLAQQNL
jgi:hypothetical protein